MRTLLYGLIDCIMVATPLLIEKEINAILGIESVIKNNTLFDIIFVIKNTLFDIINAHWRTSSLKLLSKTFHNISSQKF